MRGLRTQENEKFKKFFSVVQEKAAEKGKVFFLDSGEGRECITKNFDGEDLSGWLIPKKEADKFEEEWENRSKLDKWINYFCFAIWKEEKGIFMIEFRKE